MRDYKNFQKLIWQFYQQFGRQFAWRNNPNPYHVLVSEIMLQQTQTYRVEPKFDAFITAFPTLAELADASLHDVLTLWQGLGYNRRGKALWENAYRICSDYQGVVPNDPAILETFKHIGPNTARSIVAFAYNKPVVFIETNVRAVYLHHFFKAQENVHDKVLMPLITETLDATNPREWYYALMDYGVHLKKSVSNPSRKSAHYVVQSKFQGSDRQIRGRIIKQLTKLGKVHRDVLITLLGNEHERYKRILEDLVKEGMVSYDGEHIAI